MRYCTFLLCFIVTQSFSQGFLDFHFKSNNIKGAVVIFNEEKNEWIFNDDKEAFWNTPAASHFHLWQTLVGLETKVLSMNEKNVYKWDGVKRSFFGERKVLWNKDMNLSQALKYKNDFYFNQLKNSLSREIYVSNIEKGSFLKDIKDVELPYFWNFTGLTNPNTMILFLKDLHKKSLPFNQQSQNFLLSQLSLNENIILHTSSTSYLGEKIEWTIGIYNAKKNPIYFSYRTQLSVEEIMDEDYLKRRDRVLLEIFQSLGY